MLKTCLLVVLLSTVVHVLTEDEPKKVGEQYKSNVTSTDKAYSIYTRLFLDTRKMQLQAVASMRQKDDYAKRYDLLKVTLHNIIKVLSESWLKANDSNLLPPQNQLPDNEGLKDVLTAILENTALLGDMAIQLPEMTKDIYRRHKGWKPIVKWALDFCNRSSVYQDYSAHVLHLKLMAQELGLIARDPLLQNPYKTTTAPPISTTDKRNKKRHEKKTKRGPKLRGARVEL